MSFHVSISTCSADVISLGFTQMRRTHRARPSQTSRIIFWRSAVWLRKKTVNIVTENINVKYFTFTAGGRLYTQIECSFSFRIAWKQQIPIAFGYTVTVIHIVLLYWNWSTLHQLSHMSSYDVLRSLYEKTSRAETEFCSETVLFQYDFPFLFNNYSIKHILKLLRKAYSCYKQQFLHGKFYHFKYWEFSPQTYELVQ